MIDYFWHVLIFGELTDCAWHMSRIATMIIFQHYFCIFLLIICPFFIKIYFCFYFNFILFVKKSSFSYVIKAYSIQVRAMRMFRYILFEHPMPCHEFKKCEFNNCNWHDTTNHHVHLIIKGMFIVSVFFIFNILLSSLLFRKFFPTDWCIFWPELNEKELLVLKTESRNGEDIQ